MAEERARAEQIEEPRYRIVAREANFEVREYEPKIVAETEVEGSYRHALNEGFRRLANFIFGNNTGKASIAMTAPVSVQEKGEKIAMTVPVSSFRKENAWVVAFTMPAQYTLETLPKPNDSRISIRQVEAKRVAALVFSGRASERAANSKIQQLLDALKGAAMVPIGEPVIAQYNPPWVLPFFRRNEILVDVE